MSEKTNTTSDVFDREKAIEEIERLHVTDDVFLHIRASFNRHLDTVAAGAKESRAFVIAAESGAGKTHTITNLIAADRFAETSDDMGDRRPLICVTAPAPCTLKALGLEIIDKMTGEFLSTRTTEHEIWRRVRNIARTLGVEVLVIDEMHHLFDSKNDKDVAAVLATLKRLLVAEVYEERQHATFRPITLVLAGMPTLRTVLGRDLQVQRRCIFETISADGTDAISKMKQTKFVALLEKRLSEILGKDQSFTAADMVVRLVSAADAYRGRICVLLKEAAKMAVMDRSRVIDRVKHLSVVFREIYEVNDQTNPFLMADPTKYKPLPPAERDIATRIRGTKKKEA